MSKEQLEKFNEKQLARLPHDKVQAVRNLMKKMGMGGEATPKTMAVTRSQFAKVCNRTKRSRVCVFSCADFVSC